MYNIIRYLFILFILFGCTSQIPSYEPFINIPDSAQNLKATYIGLGQGKTFSIKFEVDADALGSLVQEICSNALVVGDNPFPKTVSDSLPEWWDVSQYSEMLRQSCWNNGASYQIAAIEIESSKIFTVFVQIGIL